MCSMYGPITGKLFAVRSNALLTNRMAAPLILDDMLDSTCGAGIVAEISSKNSAFIRAAVEPIYMRRARLIPAFDAFQT